MTIKELLNNVNETSEELNNFEKFTCQFSKTEMKMANGQSNAKKWNFFSLESRHKSKQHNALIIVIRVYV